MGINDRSTLSTIEGNSANNNADTGIALGGSGSTIRGNRADSNGTWGIFVGIAGQGTSNRVQANTTEFNQYGIGVLGRSNAIEGNTAMGNYTDDLADFNANCDANTWLGNTFVTSNETCIH